jgi:HD-GYP domain-containing protein (c-di-GMP phosphodiesterase class II)
MNNVNTYTIFTPIVKETLQKGESYPYNIYRQVDEKIFSILLKKNEIFDTSPQCFVVDENISNLFIKSTDKHKYQIYIQKHISDILDNQTISLDAKASLIKEIASVTMYDLFQSDVNSENLLKINTLVNNSIKLILTDKNAMYSMLKVTTYDYYTYTHCIDVATYALGFGSYLQLELDDLNTLGKAAMLHDLGKKNIPYEIITKNDKLTTDEYELIKGHPLYSVELLQQTGETNQKLLTLIAQHHEKCDGTGYPYGLKEEQIDTLAKIIAVCDVFNALTTQRTYKNRMSSYDAFKIMCNEMSHHLCKKTLKHFIGFMGCKEYEKNAFGALT